MACNKNAASALIVLLLDMHYKHKPGVQLFESVALRLGKVMGTINEVLVTFLNDFFCANINLFPGRTGCR